MLFGEGCVCIMCASKKIRLQSTLLPWRYAFDPKPNGGPRVTFITCRSQSLLDEENATFCHLTAHTAFLISFSSFLNIEVGTRTTSFRVTVTEFKRAK